MLKHQKNTNQQNKRGFQLALGYHLQLKEGLQKAFELLRYVDYFEYQLQKRLDLSQ